MGQCLSSEQDLTEEGKKAKLQSAKIDRDLYEYAKREMNVVKILMLGAAESGKSTLVKQMKIIHSHGFTRQELTSFKVHAHSVLSCGRCFDEDQVLFPFIGHAISCLWADQGVREAATRGYEFELNDSALYFFENRGRIISPDYVPTETDVLRVRLRTTGVIETQFKVKHLLFRMYDVGGQRTERRKWIGCFEDVRAVVFVVSLSGYDMTLVEDPCMNRLQESLKLFSSICNNIFFKSTSMILFMNKIDLFQEKILHSGRHLRLYVPQFKGADCDVDAAARYIAGMFVSLNATPSKLIYHHFTTATDTSNVQIVFQVVMDTIIKENLEAVSLL
ncbi:guanine nucleotide-binding protein G(o) subunit alpha-like isoform X2 [Salvelinus namaycush]|uniref:Guanine nucleotide-binding protein G(O) subunit alpha-like isoform X2 n=1 Tax=Salvelinus namaycush TaxID=8040 RepID=A0A8U0TJP8_SALNM|nr:guanine nucleotide-binding protein G(o) subunit alpha-like isoform X2 [Salvelinus namaycush]